MKTFTYTKITSSHGDEDYGYDFEFEADSNALLDAVADIAYRTYFSDCLWEVNKYNFKRFISEFRRFISDTDILDALVEYYEDDLKDYFKEEAFEGEDNG